jgi:hypothetical protein
LFSQKSDPQPDKTIGFSGIRSASGRYRTPHPTKRGTSPQKFQNPESSRRLVLLLKAGAVRTASRFPFSISPLANLRAGISPQRKTRKPRRNVSSRPARLPVVCPDNRADPRVM